MVCGREDCGCNTAERVGGRHAWRCVPSGRCGEEPNAMVVVGCPRHWRGIWQRRIVKADEDRRPVSGLPARPRERAYKYELRARVYHMPKVSIGSALGALGLGWFLPAGPQRWCTGQRRAGGVRRANSSALLARLARTG
jgi:hypothetical protein